MHPVFFIPPTHSSHCITRITHLCYHLIHSIMVSPTNLALSALALFSVSSAAPAPVKRQDCISDVRFTNVWPEEFCIGTQYGFHWEGGSGHYNLLATLTFDGQFSAHVSAALTAWEVLTRRLARILPLQLHNPGLRFPCSPSGPFQAQFEVVSCLPGCPCPLHPLLVHVSFTLDSSLLRSLLTTCAALS